MRTRGPKRCEVISSKANHLAGGKIRTRNRFLFLFLNIKLCQFPSWVIDFLNPRLFLLPIFNYRCSELEESSLPNSQRNLLHPVTPWPRGLTMPRGLLSTLKSTRHWAKCLTYVISFLKNGSLYLCYSWTHRQVAFRQGLWVEPLWTGSRGSVAMNTRTGRVPLQWHMSAWKGQGLWLWFLAPLLIIWVVLGKCLSLFVPLFASVCPAPAPWMMASPTQKPKRHTEIWENIGHQVGRSFHAIHCQTDLLLNVRAHLGMVEAQAALFHCKFIVFRL